MELKTEGGGGVDWVFFFFFFLNFTALYKPIAPGKSPETKLFTKLGAWHQNACSPPGEAATPWLAKESATMLQDLGQTETEQETKFLRIAIRICLNKPPSGLSSNRVDVNAFPKFDASVSRIILVIPSSSALSKP
jgi:hypothetical protein